MFQSTVGRSAIGLSLAVCMFWVSWTQGHQSQGNRSEPSLSGDSIVLPTGFLPTKPLSAVKPTGVDLSADNLAAYSEEPGTYADFLPLFVFSALSASQDRYGIAAAQLAAKVASGDTPEKPPMASDREWNMINPDLAQAAADLFGTPFNAFFSSVFGLSGLEAASALPAGEGDQNPFTQAKQDSDTAASSTPAEVPGKSNKSDDASKPMSSDARQTFGNAEARFLFLGDWDGSGTLQSGMATRINDATFAFTDGQRTFSLFINPTAVEQQRSLAIEDVNGDVIPDIVAVAGDSLFGGVYSGDASGNFTLTDTFVTGYEPKLAVVGPWYGARREIITVDSRSGVAATHRFADGFRLFRKQSLDFVPDYVSHLIDQNQGFEHLMAAELGPGARTYQVLDDGTLVQDADHLPSQPSLAISRDFLGKGGPQGLLQVFQVGPSASLVLSNSNGDTYNVANLRVSSEIFIVIGDLNNDGTVDVGVARLK